MSFQFFGMLALSTLCFAGPAAINPSALAPPLQGPLPMTTLLASGTTVPQIPIESKKAPQTVPYDLHRIAEANCPGYCHEGLDGPDCAPCLWVKRGTSFSKLTAEVDDLSTADDLDDGEEKRRFCLPVCIHGPRDPICRGCPGVDGVVPEVADVGLGPRGER